LEGSKYQALIQIGFEFKKLVEAADIDPAQTTALVNLLSEVKTFEKKLPQIHRVIRRHTSAVEFTNPKLTIRGFGRMQVRVGGKLIANGDWKTQAVRDLFFFILAHPEGVTKEEIGEAFWPDADRDTLKLRFKNTIYRLRRAVGPESITFNDDNYRFNRAVDYDYDVDIFLNELETAKQAADTEERIDHYRVAIASYRGALLPKLDQDWVMVTREKYHLAFMNAAFALSNLYIKTGKYSQAVAVANRALEEDNYNEAIHRSAMLAYSALDDRPAVVRQFERCKLILKKELDLEPSPKTIQLYNSLMHH
jgi:two-component SAPR family response regulator